MLVSRKPESRGAQTTGSMDSAAEHAMSQHRSSTQHASHPIAPTTSSYSILDLHAHTISNFLHPLQHQASPTHTHQHPP